VNLKRVQYRFYGVVQGVGFRPFLYRLAVQNGLAGFVQNRPEGVTVEVEGPAPVVDAFALRVREELPPLSNITRIESAMLDIRNDQVFQIIPSDDEGRADVHIPPDAATCPDCLAELFDPSNRRYRYPFINCTNCGPRLTIINTVPMIAPIHPWPVLIFVPNAARNMKIRPTAAFMPNPTPARFAART